jgi:hypothetical protein
MAGMLGDDMSGIARRMSADESELSVCVRGREEREDEEGSKFACCVEAGRPRPDVDPCALRDLARVWSFGVE